MSTPFEWDDAAEDFDAQPDHGLGDTSVRSAWRELMRSALPVPPARVADLGCGTGTLCQLLAELGYEVDGVDFSARMIERAGAKTAGHSVRLWSGDAADPPLPEGQFDAVLCRHVLWALPDPAAALQQWVRLLAPAGRLVLIEGRWHTGAGLTGEQCARLLSGTGRSPVAVCLDDEIYWGGPITDERYLITA